MNDVHPYYLLIADRLKQAECDGYKAEIQSLKMELLFLQRKVSTGSVPSVPPSNIEGQTSNNATWGSPDTKTSETEGKKHE